VPPWDAPIAALTVQYGLPPSPLGLTANQLSQRLNAAALTAGLINSRGLQIQFADIQTVSAIDYENSIFDQGIVPTRMPAAVASSTDVWHDYLNALMWFYWPKTKAALNAAQHAAIELNQIQQSATSQQPVNARGSVRDRLTLLDESGVVVLCTPAMNEAFKKRDWQSLFLGHKAAIENGDFAVYIIGHGLLQRLQAPYKAITGHSWVFEMSKEIRASSSANQQVADALLSEQALTLAAPRPLPLMGLPNWHKSWFEGLQDQAFYNDSKVFRK
jgi:Protein of unknown function (DUF3025)